MTSGLRKVHKYSWLLLTPLVAVLLFFAVRDIAVFQTAPMAEVNTNFSHEKVLKTFEDDFIKVAVYSNTVHMILKTSLRNPSSTVYAIDDNGDKKEIIGQLTSTGIYDFEIHAIPKDIMVYDDIKDIVITKTDF